LHYKILLPNSRNICCRYRSYFQELLFRAIPISCQGIGGFYGHCKQIDVLLFGIDPPTSAQVGAAPGNWHLCENVKLEIGNRWDEIAGSHLDWSEQWGAYVCGKDQGHCQIVEFMQICRGCQGSCTMWGTCLEQDSLCMLWKKKNWWFSCVTIVTKWLLHLG